MFINKTNVQSNGNDRHDNQFASFRSSYFRHENNLPLPCL